MLLCIIVVHNHCCVECHCVNMPQFMYPSTADGHLDYFQLGAVLDGVAMDIWVPVLSTCTPFC